jgi:hypothetical protein
MARIDKIRAAIVEVLAGYQVNDNSYGIVSDTEANELADEIIAAIQADTQPGVLSRRQILAKHLLEYHPRVKISTRDTFEALGKKHSHEHHHMTVTSHYHDGPNRGPNERPAGWKTGFGVIITPPRKGY